MSTTDQKAIEAALDKLYNDELLIYKNLKQSRFNQISQDWFNFALSFSSATSSLIDIVLKDPKSYDNKLCVIPIIYNLRHSVELTLKYLIRASTKKTPDLNHNIMNQFETLNKDLRKNDYYISDFVKEVSNDSITEETARKTKLYVVDKFEGIVNKYYFHTALTDILEKSQFYIEDKNNELFKYPEATNIVFNFSTPAVMNMDITKMQDIKRDLRELRTSLLFLYAILNKGTLSSK